MEKSVEQKLNECRQVIIQNVEKSMQNTMVFRYLKEVRIENEVKKYTLNNKDGFISIEFQTAEQAKSYYERANFKDKILIRPFNIYYNLTLNENEMKKYYFEGLTEENMREMFELARTVGVVKVYTSYTSSTSSGKLKPNGILSFIRKNQLTEAEFNGLSQKLTAIGVKLSPYKPEKGVKCSVILTNFYTGSLDDSEEKITEESQTQAEKMIKNACQHPDCITQVTPIVKRREVPSSDDKEGSKTITKVRAIVEFKTSQDAIDEFEKIRIAFIKLGEAKATLNFHNYETNSYISLFTSGLSKPEENMSDKEFEDVLVEAFRHVNKEVVQVNVFPAFNKSFVARVYLKSEEAGKDFIVDFPTKREFIHKFYKDNNSIKFNINVDDKTMKRIKVMQKRAGQIMMGVKNESDNLRIARENKPKNQQHLGMIMPMVGPNMRMSPNMPPHINPSMNPSMNPNMPPMGGRSQYPGMGQPQMMNQPPAMGQPFMGQPPSQMAPTMNSPQDIEKRIAKTVADKAKVVESAQAPGAEKNVKQSFANYVRYILESKLNVSPSESNIQMNKILMNNDVGTIVDFFANPKDMYSRVYKN